MDNKDRESLENICSTREMAAMKVIESLRPFYEEMQKTGSVTLKRQLRRFTELFNQILDEMMKKDSVDPKVIELKILLIEIKATHRDITEYGKARLIVEDEEKKKIK